MTARVGDTRKAAACACVVGCGVGRVRRKGRLCTGQVGGAYRREVPLERVVRTRSLQLACVQCS